ncbi:hypothetical protein M378DRAFT_169753 [Amanita muscaria Koide BX008]|uniref:Uncharacterized protein n=1 Tax=Amanita muscaria (strain Koide BX008) TaxID=946122 RepID=A0A0C2WCS4_AMAMK|nr:hypothetical protein M378DRAFT_169753 [Amanita muscaria Koide BX008]
MSDESVTLGAALPLHRFSTSKARVNFEVNQNGAVSQPTSKNLQDGTAFGPRRAGTYTCLSRFPWP